MLNLILQISSMVLCFIGLLLIIIGAKLLKQNLSFYIVFYASLFLYVCMLFAITLLDGKEGALINQAIKILNYGSILLSYFFTCAFTRWVIYKIDPQKRNLWYRRIADILLVFQSAFLIFSYLINFGFDINENNTIHRQTGYIYFVLIWFLSLGYIGFLIVKHHKSLLMHGSLQVFFSLSIVAIAGIILQIVFNEVQFLSIAVSICAIIYEIFFLTYLIRRINTMEKEAEKLKIDIMLSQIQPHFLYNSLTTIKYLCRTNPDAAGDAITMFSIFLRGNMDSLSASAPIDFTKEIKHTRAYLSLEKYRFNDDLKIEEHLECTSFTLPALTLQPIVENAVRHGIRESENGFGTVVISTKEYPDRYEIVVEDNGKGFDIKSLEELDSGHMGVRNVRYRLEQICKGSLTFDSTIGQGTTAKISLPKNCKNR